MTHPLDQATTLEPAGDGRWRGATTPDYMNMVGPFGGVTVACLLNAVLQDPRRTDPPVAITVNFCAPVQSGAFELTVELERAGKYLQHWTVRQHQDGSLCSTATVVTGRRSETFSHQPDPMPEVPAPHTLTPQTPPEVLRFLKQYEFRIIEGAPRLDGVNDPLRPPLSRAWMADIGERPLDWLSLAALSDGFPFRILVARGGLVPMGTVSLSTYFLCTEEELAAQGAQPILGEAIGTRFNAHFHDQKVSFWDTAGRVLATGAQVAWFKS